MKKLIGIRLEDKNKWERRVPLIPQHVKELKAKYGIQTMLQPFDRRAIGNGDYRSIGAIYNDDLSSCSAILAVKEIPKHLLLPGKTYLFFSHTIKGQKYNMPMLQKLIELKCTLIDYECIKDDVGRRLVFFGKYAGLAGMIDALYGFGQRLKYHGFDSPLLHVKPAYQYHDLNEAKNHIQKVSEEIKRDGLPEKFAPYVFGFAGYGNVSKGAQEIFDLLPFEEVKPWELPSLNKNVFNSIYKVVFREEHIVEPVDSEINFELTDYFKHPEKYKAIFSKHIPFLTVLINAIYWDEKYPRLVTKNYLKENPLQKLDLICDISCDINGSIEITNRVTESDQPAYVYNPKNDTYTEGFNGEGIANIAVDNLPTELPRDASVEFSNALFPFIPGIVNAEMEKSFEECNLPPEIKRAVIVYKGELTPDYKYIQKFLDQQ